jgi:hypothetical protein
MTDRERLLEILNVPIYPHENVDPLEAVADYLLDNGVTFQEWIPCSERLPDHFGVFIVTVRIPTRNRLYRDSADFDPFTKTWTPSLFWGKGLEITHWMELPEPPKEDV